jgi:hypothetical protein
MSDTPKEPREEISFRQVVALLLAVAIIAIVLLVHDHWKTIQRWVETVSLVFALLFGTGVVAMLLTLSGTLNLPNPFNKYERYMWLMKRAVDRVRRGRSDEELSEWDKEHIRKIENYYQDKIDRLYD